MEEMKKKFPSLPPNYVSLQQLQERRLREQQKKQKEKEEEERRIENQRQREEKEKLKKKEEEERKLQKFGKTLEIKRKTSIDGSNRSYHQRFKEKNRRVKEKIDLDSKKQESKIIVAVALEIPNPEQKLEESMKKKKKKKKRKHKKPPPTKTLNADRKEFAPLEIDRQKVIPVVQSENSEGKNELAPSEIDREKVMIPVVLSENSEGKKKMHSRFRPKSKKLPQRETGGVSLNQTVECAGRIGGLTLVDDIKKLEIDGEIGVNENRSTAKMNHGRWELRSGSRRLGWRLPPINSNLVWVKKEENNNENSSVSHHSGGGGGGGGRVEVSQPFGDHCGGSFKASHYSDGRHYDNKGVFGNTSKV